MNTSDQTTTTVSTAFTPNIDAPTIASGAVLIDLSISVWTGRKLDKRASEDVTNSNHATKGVANVTKKLLGNCEELNAVQKFAANARNIHYAMTTPWSDLGMRATTTAMYVNKYESEMSHLQNEFYRLVDNFLDAYSWEVQDAQLKLGNLFNPDEYPTRESLADKFRFRYTAMPMPTAGDWRIDMNNETADVLRNGYAKYFNEQLTKAMGDVWERVHASLTKMSERLDYGVDPATRKIFRDTLVENVREMVDLMEHCNIANDPTMNRIQQQLKLTLNGVTPDALRADAYLRAETKKQVDEVIKNLPSLGW